MDELLPGFYFYDGTITAEDRKLHSVTQLKFLKSTLDELTSDTSLWPSKEQIEVLKEYFQTYIVEQSLKE